MTTSPVSSIFDPRAGRQRPPCSNSLHAVPKFHFLGLRTARAFRSIIYRYASATKSRQPPPHVRGCAEAGRARRAARLRSPAPRSTAPRAAATACAPAARARPPSRRRTRSDPRRTARARCSCAGSTQTRRQRWAPWARSEGSAPPEAAARAWWRAPRPRPAPLLLPRGLQQRRSERGWRGLRGVRRAP